MTYDLYLERAEARFWRRVRKVRGGCWIYEGTQDAQGRGQFAFNRRHIPAHRFAYMVCKRVPLLGLYLWPQCEETACVNPDHMSVVSRAEHMQLMRTTRASDYANKSHCRYGHKWTEGNTYITYRGWRDCKECRRESAREYYRRNRESILQKRKEKYVRDKAA